MFILLLVLLVHFNFSVGQAEQAAESSGQSTGLAASMNGHRLTVWWDVFLSLSTGKKLGSALAARQLAESRLTSIEAVAQQLEVGSHV